MCADNKDCKDCGGCGGSKTSTPKLSLSGIFSSSDDPKYDSIFFEKMKDYLPIVTIFVTLIFLLKK